MYIKYVRQINVISNVLPVSKYLNSLRLQKRYLTIENFKSFTKKHQISFKKIYIKSIGTLPLINFIQSILHRIFYSSYLSIEYWYRQITIQIFIFIHHMHTIININMEENRHYSETFHSTYAIKF